MQNNINKIIQEIGSNQGEIAKKVGVTREYLNKIIKGHITPTVPLAMRIAEALGIDVREEGIGKVFVL